MLGTSPLASLDWEGPAPVGHLASSQHFGLEVFNGGVWLTHGDLALEGEVDFLALIEHRLIPARVRCEWDRLKRKGLASVWGSSLSGFLPCW